MGATGSPARARTCNTLSPPPARHVPHTKPAPQPPHKASSQRPSTVVLHDRFIIKGGGERLALSLARYLADALCFGYAGQDGFDPTTLAGTKIIDLATGCGLPGWRTLRFLHGFRHKTAFIRDYDVAVYSGIFAPLAVRHHPEGRNIFYCHTPPRFAYDQYTFHMRVLPGWQRPLMAAYVPVLKKIFQAAAEKMDCIVVNSEHVRKRVATHLGLDSVVVHPPCDTDRFVWGAQGDYYLSTARLEPLKRVETVVRAFTAMPDKKLVVASGGGELERLRSLAHDAPNILFTGWLDEARLLELLGGCIATLYLPVEEDFGMSPVESMSAGKPVIGVREGGMTETVVHGETGLLLPPNPTPEHLAEAVESLPPRRALEMRPACRARAEQFSEQLFVQRMRAVINGRCGGDFSQ